VGGGSPARKVTPPGCLVGGTGLIQDGFASWGSAISGRFHRVLRWPASRPATRRAGPPLADIEQAKGVVRAASGEQLDAQATFERLRGGPVLDASAGG
jgi:hypothetical protein